MLRTIIPIILIGISIAGFFLLVRPLYGDITEHKTQVSSLDNALDNALELAKKKEELVSKKDSFSKDDLARLEKMLPDNIDNIRLIVEINDGIAARYGMLLKDVKYEDTKKKKGTGDTGLPSSGGEEGKSLSSDYGVWDLEFSTEGTYTNFLSFLRDLETNLRLVDIESIQFDSTNTTSSTKSNAPDTYKYTFKVRTYWLKN